MDIASIQAALTKNRQELGKRDAKLPSTLSQYAPSSDTELQGLRQNQASKVAELFKYDTQMAQRSYQPQALEGQPQPEARILDPSIGLKAASTQTQALGQELGDIGSQIATRKDYLAESMDKAMSLFKFGLEAKKLEQDSLMNEWKTMMDLEDLKVKRADSGGGNLPDLLSAITGFQSRSEAIRPKQVYKQGTTQAKGAKAIQDMKTIYNQFKAQDPDAKLEYSGNPDGTYTYTIRNKNEPAQYLGADESQAPYDNPEDTIRKMLAAGVATNPKQSGQIGDIQKLLFPEPIKQTAADSKVGERNDLINTVPDPKTAQGMAAEEIFIQARQQSQYLSDSEIKTILNAKGWFIY